MHVHVHTENVFVKSTSRQALSNEYLVTATGVGRAKKGKSSDSASHDSLPIPPSGFVNCPDDRVGLRRERPADRAQSDERANASERDEKPARLRQGAHG